MKEESVTIAVIIPNDKVLDAPVFYEECRDGTKHHEDMIRDFANMYHLENVENEEDLIRAGHIFLRAVDNLVICYIPKKVTELQYERLLNQRSFLEKFPILTASIEGYDTIIENCYGAYDTQGKDIVDCLLEEVAKNCLESRSMK